MCSLHAQLIKTNSKRVSPNITQHLRNSQTKKNWYDIFKTGETIRQSRWISYYKFILSLNRPKSGFGIYIFCPTAPIASPYMSISTNQKWLPRWPTDSHLLNTLWTHESSQTRTNFLHLHRFHGRNIHNRILMNLNT